MKALNAQFLWAALFLGICFCGVVTVAQLSVEALPAALDKGGPVLDNQLVGTYVAISSGILQLSQSINVTFTMTNVNIKGYNFHNSRYTYTPLFKISGFSSTEMACEQDEDAIVLGGLIKAVKAKNDGNFLIFYDNIGSEVLRIINQFGADINDKPILGTPNISGSYRFKIPPLHLLIEDNLYKLTGCDMHMFKFRRDAKGFIVYDGFTSTNTTCDSDVDQFYINAFKKAKIMIESPFNIRLFDLQGRLLLNLQQLILNSLDLRYYVSFSNVDGEIFQNLLKYKGCNTNTLRFTVENPNKINFGKSLSTKMACSSYDYDNLINTVLESANNFQVKADTIEFKANDTIVLIGNKKTNSSLSKPPPTRVYLQGNFIMRIIGSMLAIVNAQVDKKQLRCFDCDIVWVSYEAYSDGSFKIIQMTPKTKSSCLNDKTNEYLKNLKNVNSFRKDETGAGYYLLKDDKTIVNLQYIGESKLQK